MARKNGSQSKKRAPICPNCSAELKNVNYTVWGKKIFEAWSGLYIEDNSWGSGDAEVTCPKCSAKLDAEGILF